MILVSGTLGQIVPDVGNPLAIENMAGRLEQIRNIGPMSKVKQGRKRKPHSAPLISNRGPAQVGTDLTGQNTLMDAMLAIEEMQLIPSSGQPHLVLVEDGSPLHGGAMQHLACPTMTDLRIHRFCTHLVANAAAKAGGPVLWDKCWIMKGRIFWSESVVGR